VKGVGELTIYDTANRIGAHLGLKPEHIYLHAGTKKGAEKLLGHRIKAKHINAHDLPPAFQNKALSNAALEDILCIYKDQFDTFNPEKANGCHDTHNLKDKKTCN